MGIRAILLSWAEPELATATKLLRQVTEQLDRAMRENISLKDERELQVQTIEELKARNTELQREMVRLAEANRLLQEQSTQVTSRLQVLEQKYERLMGLYFQLQARSGNDLEL